MPTLLIKYPSISLINLIGIQPDKILNPRRIRKLRFGHTTKRKKHGTKPNFLNMSLMGIISNDLFDRKLFATLSMLTQPNQTKTPPAQQLNLLESIRKSLTKCLYLILSQAVILLDAGLFG